MFAIDTTENVVKQTQVSEQCDKLDRNTEELLAKVRSLEVRLISVLRPPSPREKMDELDLVPLASLLYDANIRVIGAVNGLCDIGNRLEL